MNKNTLAIVQARMGSSRLPNKMMLWLHGYPVVEFVYRRLLTSKQITKIIFAIPDCEKDDVLANYLSSLGAVVFRGPEEDVLTRYYLAAKQYQPDYVVRVCADNPYVSGKEIDKLVNFYDSHVLDYAYNHIPIENCYPDGLGAEIVSYSVLKHLSEIVVSTSSREHIFEYIWQNSSKFKIATFNPSSPLLHCPTVKLDLDTINDYQKLLGKQIAVDSSDEYIVSLFL